MRYLAFACDYDWTIADAGRVSEKTVAALERLRASGRKLILLTGRELEELKGVFSRLDLFDRVVVENGAVLHRPSSNEIKLLAEPPPSEFAEALRRRGVSPLSSGRVIVATHLPHETAVLEAIRDLGLDLQVIFNKGAVMALPSGVNKATGLHAALHELGLSPHNTVGVGDAENDHAFLSMCECAVAVADALPMIKAHCDLLLDQEDGDGIVDLVDALLENDLAGLQRGRTRRHILLGSRADGSEHRVSPYGLNLLLAGSSGGGKSTMATGLLERLTAQGYQFCVIDPEGDYQTLEDVVMMGSNRRAPAVEEILRLLEKHEVNAVINLLGLPVAERPAYFAELFPRLQELRERLGRPHWLVIDEAHHLLPAGHRIPPERFPNRPQGLLLITVRPRGLADAALAAMGAVIAVGDSAAEVLADFSDSLGLRRPVARLPAPQSGEAYLWSREKGAQPFLLRLAPSRTERRRHGRKYAEGSLEPERCFYFRGSEGKLNLRAQNLILFLQLADGVDDATWDYHLRRGDYSRWLREQIKDDLLANEVARIESLVDPAPAHTRAQIREAIEQHYTLPAFSSKQ